jgi:intracellular multiplication protein IcmD
MRGEIMSNLMRKNKSTLNPLISLCGYFGALAALFFVSEMVFAGGAGAGQSLGDIASNVTGTMSNVAKLITAGSYVAGVAFALMGMLKFKAHKDNPQQTPLSQPIVLLAIAAGLVFLPSLISTTGQTVWKGGERATSSGGGLEN